MNKIIIFTLLLMSIISTNASAFRDQTHKQLNNVSQKQAGSNPFDFNNFLIGSLGFNHGTKEPLDYFFDTDFWIFQPLSAGQILSNGGSLEDKTPRYFNHFHDGIENIGLWNRYDSALLWAQFPFGGQGYSWNDARHNYYTALTSPTTDRRNEHFARTFRSVGQVMHLVEDMAVPEHTRNDAHPFSPGIELYIENKLTEDTSVFAGSLAAPFFFDFKTLQTTPSAFASAGAPIPIANLFDTNIYTGSNPDCTVANTIGLAEYSNANFLSTDTNPVSTSISIPPRIIESTTLQEIDIPNPLFPWQTIKRWYHVKDRAGETANGNGYKLTAASVLRVYWQNIHGTLDGTTIPILDQNVYDDYAALLLPRAAGYAATALHYFFRGQIELSLPERGRYAIASPDQGSFDNIHIKARNITPNSEALSSGTVELVVKYKTALDDPFQGVPVPVSDDFSYIVVPEANGVASIPTDTPIELVFALGEQKGPFNATDLTVQVIYHGQMGLQMTSGFAGESNGVAVGFKDISEPTPVDYINSMDVVCVNDQILPAGSAEAVNTLDANGKSIATYVDVYPHSLANNYLKHAPQNHISYASATNYDATMALLPAGHYARYFILTEPYGTPTLLNNQMKIVRLDSRDSFSHWTQTATSYIQGMINQEVYKDKITTRYFSGMTDIRGTKTWAGIHWTNMDYPSTSTCNEADSSIPLTGPDVMILQP